MWQTFSIDVLKKVAVGELTEGSGIQSDSSETKLFLRATQGEVGVKFTAALLCNGEPYFVPDGSLFSVWYEGMSGAGNYTQIDGRSPVALDGNSLHVELIPQMISVSGGGTLAIMLHETDGSIRKLFHLTYIVDEFPGYDSAAAEEYFTAFSEAVAGVMDSVAKVDETAKAFVADTTLSEAGKPADAAATGKALVGKAPVEHGAPYNYLDNSDFRNPVNQRGQTSYTSSTYCIDRWFFTDVAPTFEIVEGVGVTVGANTSAVCFSQRFLPGVMTQQIVGKNVTFAAMTDKGLLLKTMVFPSAKGAFDRSTVIDGIQMTIGWSSSGDAAWVDIVVSADTSLTLYWAALYEGEYTAETLPNYKPKGYGVELAECMRYYQKDVRINAMHTADSYFGVSYMHSMRIAPTVTPKRFDFYGKGSVKDFAGCDFGVNGSQLQFASLPTVIASSFWTSGFKGVLTVDLSADL